MRLHAGVDTTVIGLWLGHEAVETTQMLHARRPQPEREALARITPIGAMPGRHHPPGFVPLGTTRPQIINTPDQPNPQGACGIGGPPVTPTPTTSEQNAAPTQQQMSE
jgi:hypothetical protein